MTLTVKLDAHITVMTLMMKKKKKKRKIKRFYILFSGEDPLITKYDCDDKHDCLLTNKECMRVNDKNKNEKDF